MPLSDGAGFGDFEKGESAQYDVVVRKVFYHTDSPPPDSQVDRKEPTGKNSGWLESSNARYEKAPQTLICGAFVIMAER